MRGDPLYRQMYLFQEDEHGQRSNLNFQEHFERAEVELRRGSRRTRLVARLTTENGKLQVEEGNLLYFVIPEEITSELVGVYRWELQIIHLGGAPETWIREDVEFINDTTI